MAATDDYDQSLVMEEQHMEIEALESIFMDDLKGTRYYINVDISLYTIASNDAYRGV